LLIAAVIACFSVAQPALADLIANGGFETGDFTGWTVVLDVTYPASITTLPAYVHSGTYAAQVAGSASYNELSQTVSTTPGQYYALSFWLNTITTGNDFRALWDGNAVLTGNITPQGYVQYSYVVGGTGSDTVEFDGRNVPGWFYLDDVSLTPTNAVPEPSGVVALLGLCGMGLLGMAWRRRRCTA
jgi:hypothetical protein